MEPKTGKRIVSKGEYVSIVGKYTGLIVSGWCILGLAILCGLICILGVLSCLSNLLSLSHEPNLHNLGLMLMVLVITVGMGIVSSLLSQVGFARIDNASVVSVVPLTRANTAELPAPDSLVRASSEPMQAQETVLLRATIERPETPPEQLVRPVDGSE